MFVLVLEMGSTRTSRQQIASLRRYAIECTKQSTKKLGTVPSERVFAREGAVPIFTNNPSVAEYEDEHEDDRINGVFCTW